MSENTALPGQRELLTPHLRRNMPFMATLALLVFLPGLVTFFGPQFVSVGSDFQWLLIGWGVALILVLVADENFVPGKGNLSSGFRRPGHISHELVTNGRFWAGLLVLVLGPAVIAYYGPVVVLDSPDWAWLLLGWIAAVAAVFLVYSALRSEEGRLA